MKYIRVTYFSKENDSSSFDIGTADLWHNSPYQYPSSEELKRKIIGITPRLWKRENVMILGITSFNSLEDFVAFNNGVNPFPSDEDLLYAHRIDRDNSK